MSQGFIKNEDLLKESHRVDDLLDFSLEIAQFKKRILTLNKPAILGLVGPFGVGKSTMLYQIQKEENGNAKWINFDAWKYPDRQDLWEGFVLDFAKEISPKEFSETDKKIKGKQNDDKQTLVKTLSRIPGFAALEGLNHFFETSPARRVDEIQNILKEQVNKVDKDLYIVVEDIDRSGDSGVFFLETLKQFVSNFETDKKFIIIVPISDTSYYSKLESYLKSVDYFEFFQPSKIKLDKFVNEIFQDELFSGQFNRQGDNKLIWTGANRRSQVISFLEGLFIEQKGTTIRLMKLIIRKANLIFKNQVDDGHEPDFRITLCLEAAKYFNIDEKTDKKFFDDFKGRGAVVRGNIFSSFLFAILANSLSIYQRQRNGRGEEKDMLLSTPYDFKFIERVNGDVQRYPSYPWTFHDPWAEDEKTTGGITKFYLNY